MSMGKAFEHPAVIAHSDRWSSKALLEDGHGHTSGLHHVERLVDWAEEDVRLAQRRVREAFHRGQEVGDEDLEAFALRLEAELADEKRWRDAFMAQVARAEKALEEERSARTQSLQHFYHEVETSITQLVSEVEGRITRESQVVTTRAKASEHSVLSLAAQVEQGCTQQSASPIEACRTRLAPTTPMSASGSCTAPVKPDEIGHSSSDSSFRKKRSSSIEPSQSANIIDMWKELRMENARLQRQQQQLVEKHAQVVSRRGRSASTGAGIGGVRTPISRIPEA